MEKTAVAQEAPPATPIFILGKHRSGTSWLANLLCQHPDVAGIEYGDFGIYESNYFSHVAGRYGDLGKPVNYREFVEVVGASDYFRLAGADKDVLRSLGPATYAEVFRAVMDRYARRQGARAWVEKTPTHTLLADELARDFPDARFVAIRRRLEDVLKSTLYMWQVRDDPVPDRRHDSRAVRARKIRSTVQGWVLYDRVLRRFADSCDRVLYLDYEALRRDPEPRIREICAFTGLAFRPEMLQPRCPPNTSFPSGARPELGDEDRRRMRFWRGAFSLVPLSAQLLPYRRARRPRPGGLPVGFFHLTDGA